MRKTKQPVRTGGGGAPSLPACPLSLSYWSKPAALPASAFWDVRSWHLLHKAFGKLRRAIRKGSSLG